MILGSHEYNNMRLIPCGYSYIHSTKTQVKNMGFEFLVNRLLSIAFKKKAKNPE